MSSRNGLRAGGPTTVSTQGGSGSRRPAQDHPQAERSSWPRPSWPRRRLTLTPLWSHGLRPRGPSGLAGAPGQYPGLCPGWVFPDPTQLHPSVLPGRGVGGGDGIIGTCLLCKALTFQNVLPVSGAISLMSIPPGLFSLGGPLHCPPSKHEAEGGEDRVAKWPPGPTIGDVARGCGSSQGSFPHLQNGRLC